VKKEPSPGEREKYCHLGVEREKEISKNKPECQVEMLDPQPNIVLVIGEKKQRKEGKKKRGKSAGGMGRAWLVYNMVPAFIIRRERRK